MNEKKKDDFLPKYQQKNQYFHAYIIYSPE